MFSPVLHHVLDLIRRTGDRCVIVDSAKDEAFVLMSLSGYEQMMNSTRGAMDVLVTAVTEDKEGTIENANRAIAHWRDEEVSLPAVSTAGTEEEDRFYIEPVE